MTIINAGAVAIKVFVMKLLVRSDLAAEIRRVLDGANGDDQGNTG